ncbi:MAG TPA: hypothetical protein VH518_20290 [Tepidisphaeraceae bacterium]
MRWRSRFVLLWGALSAGATSALAQVAVVQIGNASFSSGSSAAPITIDYFDPTSANQPSPLSALSIASSGNSALTLSGADYEGSLVTAPDGGLVLGGYRAPAGTSFIVGSSSLVAPRAIATVHGSTVTLAANFGTSGTNDYSSNAFHGGMTDGSGHFWGAANSKGTILANGGSNVVIQSSLVNTRSLEIVGGNLYFSTISGTPARGIYSLGPTASAVAAASPTQVIPTGSSSSPVEFEVNSAQTTAYVADDRPSLQVPHTGAGIQRFDKVGGNWVLTYTLELDPAGTVGAHGLAVDWSATSPLLYASTTDNRLIRIQDLGLASPVITLSTAPTHTIFAGVELVPEPAGLSILLMGACAMRRRRA